MSLALPARAKLNLELRVSGRRDDGFHEVDTILQSIDLHDLVEVGRADSTSLEATGLPVPSGPDNLALRAVAALEAESGRSLPVRIRLTKRIPPGAGLGGGSADAAAVLVAVTRLHDLHLDLLAVASRLGSDVPFFIAGGKARAVGRGDVLAPLSFEEACYLVAWPGFETSTADVYRLWDSTGGWGDNHLEQAALASEPRLGRFAERLGPGWRMTGSGSAFFRACSDEAEAARLRSRLDCWTAVSRALPGNAP